MKIGSHDTDDRVFIIAEIGNNHEGDFAVAKDMIHAAATTGADAVKFQTFVPELYSTVLDTARQARLQGFRLSFDQFAELHAIATGAGVQFFSTPFDLESAAFLADTTDVVKVSSGDNTFFPMLDFLAQRQKPVILSTGLLGLDDVADALACLRRYDATHPVALLHCVAAYPVEPGQANLSRIPLMMDRFPDCTIGYSDHTMGIHAAELAVAAGARIVEKHFTLDKQFSDFRDHQLSADPDEMAKLVEGIRQAEEYLHRAADAPSTEMGNLVAMRRSIVAKHPLSAGHTLTLADLVWVRPGGGLPPGREDDLIGRRLATPRGAGEMIQLADLEPQA